MKNSTMIMAVMTIAMSLTACLKDEGENYPIPGQATVTFKPGEGNAYYMEVEQDLAFVALNKSLEAYPFSEKVERRAMISYLLDSEANVSPVPGYSQTYGVYVQHLVTIRTKPLLVYDAALESQYGNDPIGLYLGNRSFPTTLIEDGYLNLVFNIAYGAVNLDGPVHEINVLAGTNPDDPYELVVRHNAHGDTAHNDNKYGICDFPLNTLPDTEGKTVTLTLKWNSMVSGKMESAKFDYRSRTDWPK